MTSEDIGKAPALLAPDSERKPRLPEHARSTGELGERAHPSALAPERAHAAIGNDPSTFRYFVVRLSASSAVVTGRSVTCAPSST